MDYIILIKKSKILIIFKIIQNKHIFEIFNFFILFMNKEDLLKFANIIKSPISPGTPFTDIYNNNSSYDYN